MCWYAANQKQAINYCGKLDLQSVPVGTSRIKTKKKLLLCHYHHLGSDLKWVYR